MSAETAEDARLRAADTEGVPWRRWGPYLAERQWGTVREIDPADEDAWSSFSHDQARSRAYRWGEDGLLGICDDTQRLCFALALWNGRDPILKERAFGLTNGEGNHGEDVKEYYHHLDATPTSSYLRALYRYPHRAFPYEDLVRTNAARSRQEPEYELIDTGVFEGNRHFDVVVEYAKADPEDVLVRITAHNRGPDPATLHLLPTLWFRDTWWRFPTEPRPILRADGDRIVTDHAVIGRHVLRCDGQPELLVTENVTNGQRLWGVANAMPYVKDGINDAVVDGRLDACNPDGSGTKAAVHHVAEVPAGGAWTIRLRLTRADGATAPPFGPAFDDLFAARRAEADRFYESLTPPAVSDDAAAVMRQALAGILWSKQYYDYDLDRWLNDRGIHPLRDAASLDRPNARWFHMVTADIISMPDTWEYPWFAAWDLALHTIPLGMVDLTFARDQLRLLLGDRYLHPNGQIPAYEWNFSDVNPPVQALASFYCFAEQGEPIGKDGHDFLEDMFLKLLLNFTWWVNRKDPTGAGAFEGGFLGLDNIGVFDRSGALPTGGRLEQADGTAWMALYCQNMLEISIELARQDDTYWAMALKFVEHFFYIAAALERVGDANVSMWDDEDGFFYDFLRFPDGSGQRLRVRSMVGLLPFCAVTVMPGSLLEETGGGEIMRWFFERHPDLAADIALPVDPGVKGRRILTVLGEDRLRRVLDRLLDPAEFLSPYGIRSLSRYHLDHPYEFDVNGHRYSVGYLPAESDTGMFGGNSNWRGPVWFPVNMLIIRALVQYYRYYGDGFIVEHPTGSGRKVTLFEVAQDLAGRLVSIFLRDATGRRPVFGGVEVFQSDPHWRDDLLFYEYFHGDDGAGIGASHQTGWTALVAKLIQLFGHLDAAAVLDRDQDHPTAWHYRRP